MRAQILAMCCTYNADISRQLKVNDNLLRRVCRDRNVRLDRDFDGVVAAWPAATLGHFLDGEGGSGASRAAVARTCMDLKRGGTRAARVIKLNGLDHLSLKARHVACDGAVRARGDCNRGGWSLISTVAIHEREANFVFGACLQIYGHIHLQRFGSRIPVSCGIHSSKDLSLIHI